VDQRGQLVEKQQVLDAVWKDAFVTENALARVVAQLRKALGDDAKRAAYIETVPTRGYRFLPVVEVAPEEPQTKRERRFPRSKAIYGGAALLVAAVLLVVITVRPRFGEVTSDGTTGSRPSSPIQLTTSPTLEVFPDLAPDGSAVAYSSNREGSFEIYVQPLAPGGRDIAITSDGGQNTQPAWSPDGTQIAYHSLKRGGIWIVPALGGVARRLTDFGSEPAWSPDGDRIAFQTRPQADFGIRSATTYPPSTLWISPAGGGAPRRVTEVGKPDGGHGVPVWLGDDRLAFVAHGSKFYELWTVSTSGEALRRLLTGMEYFDLAYAPVSKQLFFTARSSGRNWGLWRVALSSTGEPRAGEPTLVSSAAPSFIRYHAVSADGRKFAYAALSSTSNIGSLRVSPETYEPLGPPTLLTTQTNDINTVPRFSPDGTTIAFLRGNRGGDDGMWLMNTDGDDPRQIMSGDVHHVFWSPAGDRVYYGTAEEIRSLELDSGRVERVHTKKREWGMWSLSPDGETFAFHSRTDGILNVWTVPVGSSMATQLTFDEEGMGFPAWSPDGKRLAVELLRGDSHVGVVAATGGPVTQMTDEPGQSYLGEWSPDGNWIVFPGLRGDAWNIWAVSIRDQSTKRLTDYTSVHHALLFPAFSPTGDQIIYEYQETTGDIWLLELE